MLYHKLYWVPQGQNFYGGRRHGLLALSLRTAPESVTSRVDDDGVDSCGFVHHDV